MDRFHEDRTKGAYGEAPFVAGVLGGRLKIELQSELDLSRVVGGIASRADFTKSVAGVVARTGNSHDTVAAKIGGTEIGMIGNVENFGPELQILTFGDREVFEEGPVHPVETGARHLCESS